MIIDQITETLEKLPKDYALMAIFKLMADNHITFADIVNEHIDLAIAMAERLEQRLKGGDQR